MPGLGPGIHVLAATKQRKTWMAGTKPGHDGKSIIFKCQRALEKHWLLFRPGSGEPSIVRGVSKDGRVRPCYPSRPAALRRAPLDDGSLIPVIPGRGSRIRAKR